MNVPSLALMDEMLKLLGTSTLGLGNGSIGLIAAPFTPSSTLPLSSITEANYTSYHRQAIGTPSVPFTSSDGKEYVEGLTLQFMPSDTVTPNTIYGAFVTFGNSTTAVAYWDPFAAPISLAGPSNQITITARFGADPLANWGLEVISS